MHRLLPTLSAIILLSNLSAQVPGYVPSDGLVGWWPFNDNANDESGGGLNGIVNNAVSVSDRLGNLNSAYLFNGTDAHIIVDDPNNGALDLQGLSFTISAWLTTSQTALASLVTKQNAAIPNESGDYNLDMEGLGRARMAMGYGVGQGDARVSSTSINDAQWHHVVAVYSPVAIELYIDGVLSTEGPSTISAPTSLSNSVQPLLFGMAVPNTTPFNGTLDDIGFWNRALTTDEVAGLYTGSGVGVAETLPTASELLVFPNPGNGKFTLEHSLSGLVFVRVFDVTGRLAYNAMFQANGNRSQQSLDLVGLVKGSYTLQAQSNAGAVTQKVLVE